MNMNMNMNMMKMKKMEKIKKVCEVMEMKYIKQANKGKEGMGDIRIKCDKEDKGEKKVGKLVQESHLQVLFGLVIMVWRETVKETMGPHGPVYITLLPIYSRLGNTIHTNTALYTMR